VKPFKQENIFIATCASLPIGQCLHSVYTDITRSLIYIIPCGRLHLSALAILLTYSIRIQICSSTPRTLPSDSHNKSSLLPYFLRFASSPQQVSLLLLLTLFFFFFCKSFFSISKVTEGLRLTATSISQQFSQNAKQGITNKKLCFLFFNEALPHFVVVFLSKRIQSSSEPQVCI